MANTTSDQNGERQTTHLLLEPFITAHWDVITQMYAWNDLGEQRQQLVFWGQWVKIYKTKLGNKEKIEIYQVKEVKTAF